MLSNRFEVLRDRMMQRRKGSGSEVGKDRKIILRKKELRGGKSMADKSREEGEERKDIERSNDEDWVKAERRRRRNCNRNIVG